MPELKMYSTDMYAQSGFPLPSGFHPGRWFSGKGFKGDLL